MDTNTMNAIIANYASYASLIASGDLSITNDGTNFTFTQKQYDPDTGAEVPSLIGTMPVSYVAAYIAFSNAYPAPQPS